MFRETFLPTTIEAAKQIVLQPCLRESLKLNLQGFNINFGLPELKEINEHRKVILVPSLPYIFKVDLLVLRTKRKHIDHELLLYDQMLLLGHGKKHRDDPRTWFFEDGQDVIQLVASYNSLNNGLPPIDLIVSCRRVLFMQSKGKTFKSTRLPLGWKKIPGVIFQKNGKPTFGGIVQNGVIKVQITNKDSDFIKATKKGKIRNIRKIG